MMIMLLDRSLRLVKSHVSSNDEIPTNPALAFDREGGAFSTCWFLEPGEWKVIIQFRYTV